MASKINTNGRNPWVTDLWIKPLMDGDFAVAFINKDSVAHEMSVVLSGDTNGQRTTPIIDRLNKHASDRLECVLLQGTSTAARTALPLRSAMSSPGVSLGA